MPALAGRVAIMVNTSFTSYSPTLPSVMQAATRVMKSAPQFHTMSTKPTPGWEDRRTEVKGEGGVDFCKEMSNVRVSFGFCHGNLQ